jgi:glycine cleavage system aminomethyltransferase T
MVEDPRDLRDLHERATEYRKPAWSERPFFGGPAAPAQAETNTSDAWGHVNGGMLIGYEYSRWWKESLALRNDAVLGDWSWLGKTRIEGPDAAAFMARATVRDCREQAVGQVMFTPMVNEAGAVAVEGLTYRRAADEFLFTQSGGYSWLRRLAAEAVAARGGIEALAEQVLAGETDPYTVADEILGPIEECVDDSRDESPDDPHDDSSEGE